MVTSVVEVERKYDVGADSEVPDLGGLPGVDRVLTDRFVLEAVYLDTEDLRLRAAGTTLRLRRGGPDAGWHLKLPHGADREELALPADDGADASDVPQELQALVRSRTRTAALVPVAELRTTRSVHRLVAADARVLAEVADDQVTGRPLGGGADVVWREWEVELVGGPRSLLDEVGERLAAAGATPSGSGSKVGRVLGQRPGATWWGAAAKGGDTAGAVLHAHLREQVEELVVRDPQVRRDRPDAVHRMRVATRRLRSALQTFRPLLDRAQTDPLRDELRHLAGVLGQARDAEVMHARLQARVAEQDPALVMGPVSRRIDLVLQQRYRAAHEAVLVELEGERYLRLLDDLTALVAAPPLTALAAAPAREVLPGLVRRAWRRLDRALRAAAREGDDALLHEARKDAKRVRYAAEAVRPVFGRPAKRLAKEVTGLQEVLGEHQDGVVVREALRELAVLAQAAGESAFTYGRLHALEEARAAAAVRGWRRVRRQVSRKRLRRWLR